jgi:WD40 repeat protein
MEITAVQWHPTEKNIILTSSLDGSLRVWDLEGPRTFDQLVCKAVLKIRAVSVQNRIGATSCGYTPTGNVSTSYCTVSHSTNNSVYLLLF